MITRERPKVYLAGPGVFRPDTAQFGEELKAICLRHGLEGLWPLDGLAASEPPTSRRIFESNIALIHSAAGIIADIGPFRGPHADDGTAFEIGFAHALGLPIFAWTTESDPLAWRIAGQTAEDGVLRDADGYEIEDFAAPANLMLVEAVQYISVTAEDAITAAAQHFRTYLKPV